jgi:pimeloyl-ACP methyl ester carboxylesterase
VLHIDHGGDGPVIVLVHAFPLDSGMFDRLVPLLTPHARVVTVDLPGLGGSNVPATTPSMDDIADRGFRTLDALGVGTAVVLGISTGGYVALQMAARAPERISALVLGSTTPHRIEPDVPDERRAVADEIERLGSTAPVAAGADEALGETAHERRPDLVDALRRTIADADPDGVAWMVRAIADRADTTDALREYPGPVLLLFGAEDEVTPPSRGQEMLGLRGNAPTRLVVLPQTGHLTPLESPERVAAELIELLEGL